MSCEQVSCGRSQCVAVVTALQAPEVGQGDEDCEYNSSADMWSLGVTVALLLVNAGRRPWWRRGTHPLEVASILLAAVEGRGHRCCADRGDQLRSWWRSAYDLVERLLKYWPEERLTAEKVLEHPFVQMTATAGIPVKVVLRASACLSQSHMATQRMKWLSAKPDDQLLRNSALP